MKKTKRIIGIDLIKSMACILVILLHTSAPAFFINGAVVPNSFPSQIIYYLGTGAVPLFFMANAFFLVNRPTMSYKYISKKILLIMIPVALWNGVIFIAYLLKNKITNYIILLLGSLLQKGFFFQFWFLGSLMILLLFVPTFNKLLKYSIKSYIVVLCLFLLVCFSFDLVNHIGLSTPIQSHVIQTFRLWTWFSYYMLGGLIGHFYFTKKELFSNTSLGIVSGCLTVLSITYSIFNKDWIHNIYAEFNYDNILIMLWISVSFMFLISLKSFSNRIINNIELVSSNSMGIYIVHVPVLKIFTHFIPISGFESNILAIIFIFTISLMISFIFGKFRITHFLVKL